MQANSLQRPNLWALTASFDALGHDTWFPAFISVRYLSTVKGEMSDDIGLIGIDGCRAVQGLGVAMISVGHGGNLRFIFITHYPMFWLGVIMLNASYFSE